jgi:serine/threonine protein kinase
MSRDQTEGGVVDDRSDVFSFGVLVYELLTGRRVFERSSVPETLTAVLREDPELPSDWPHALAAIVRRCLRKDPERRFQSMADVRIELQEVLEAQDGGLDTGASTPAAHGAFAIGAQWVARTAPTIAGTSLVSQDG